jgi:MYXO-CTERM domain-containing protein
MRAQALRLTTGLLLSAALLCGAAEAAAAHIQVSPTLAAPNDAVKFTVLVPGEKASAETTRVELKIPPGVLPYSYGETPGWNQRLAKASDNSVDRIVWTGRLAPDAFAEFSFLAATPPRPGPLRWKALQLYSDGEVVRWIGAPDSENPAPVTEVVAGAPLQNAGGEGAGGEDHAADSAAEGEGDSSSEGDGLSRGLAIAALALAAVALGLAWRRGRSS